jgi:tetratricopeptide (TPR) repeat protein
MRSQNRGFYQSRRKTVQQAILPVFFVVAVLAIAMFFIIRNSNEIVPDDDNSRVAAAWESGQYAEAASLSDDMLRESPLDSMLLLYNGFSNFYQGITLVNHDERQAHLNRAMFSLRKLLYAPPSGYEEEIWYILGKTYFHKGSYFYDNAAKYFEQCLTAGYEAEDILEFLGVIYLELGDIEKGIDYLLQAIEKNPKEILFFTAAEAFEMQEDYQQALDYFVTSQNLTDDSFLIQQANIGRGRVLFVLGRLDEAKAILEQVIAENSQSAEAYFYLGEIYSAQGDQVKARANWREAYNQDRTFTPALERLQS